MKTRHLLITRGGEGNDGHVGRVEERPPLDEHVPRDGHDDQHGQREQAPRQLRLEQVYDALPDAHRACSRRLVLDARLPVLYSGPNRRTTSFPVTVVTAKPTSSPARRIPHCSNPSGTVSNAALPMGV